MTAPIEELVGEGRAALRRGDADAARQRFEEALEQSATGDVLAGLAQVAFLEQEFLAAVEGWERAYAAYREAADHVAAGRTAQTLAYVHGMILGHMAVMSGWLARADTLLDGAEDTAAIGWVALYRGMFEGDPARREHQFREALTLARRFDAPDLELNALAYLGATLVHVDRTEEGMLLLDEALAALAGHEVDDFMVLQEVFCQLFSACEHAHDVTRADQWIRIGEGIAEQRRLPAVAAFCRTHYGGLLTTAGRWPEADVALTEAVRLWALGPRSQRGAALARLAALRVRQGRLEEAALLLHDVDVDLAAEAALPMAALHLAHGEATLATDVLERALDHVAPDSPSAAPALALLVDAHLAAGRVEDAAATADLLAQCAARHDSQYLIAVAALAQGRVCLACDRGDPQACLRQALAAFRRAQMPVEVASSRLELAAALVADHPEAAMVEARAAYDAFEQLQAARQVDAAAALLRSLGVRSASAPPGGGVLTKREGEVLELVGHGLSNPEISERLFISRKTVEHHVGNVLAKLGLRSRAEAAAYAARAGSAPE